MSEIRFGCQTYTWQMSYETYSQKLDHIINVVSQSGMTGIEPEICMLGPYDLNPVRLKDDLNEKSVELAALCLVCDWRNPEETDEERTEADRIIAMIQQHFPGTLLALCQMPGEDRNNLRERQDNCMSIMHAIGQRSADVGVSAAFHPNSPDGSVFRVAEDYELLLDAMKPEVCGFAPDFGHIAKGGMDPVAICETYANVIRHVHFKDMKANGTWAEMGQGGIDFAGIVRVLKDAGYDGWIMVEDESPRAESEPDAVTMANGDYIREVFY